MNSEMCWLFEGKPETPAGLETSSQRGAREQIVHNPTSSFLKISSLPGAWLGVRPAAAQSWGRAGVWLFCFLGSFYELVPFLSH